MATKLLTKKELEYLKETHPIIDPYFTHAIRVLEYKLDKCTTPKERKEVDAISVKDLRKYGKKFGLELYTQRIINRLLSKKSLRIG